MEQTSETIAKPLSEGTNGGMRPWHGAATTGVRVGWLVKRLMPVRGPYIFLASMPKSGSTFMATALAELTGYRYVGLSDAYERHDQNLYLPKVIDVYGSGSVTHQHIRATAANLDLMRRFHIRPVVMVRNLFDVVVSIRDHLLKEGFAFPTMYCDERFLDLDERTQLDFIIDLSMPWYLNFYVSWYVASQKAAVPTLWLRYEDAIRDWGAAVKQIADFYGLERSEEEIQRALERTGRYDRRKIRLNKGVAGRGARTLTRAQQQRIVRLARYYPWVDFSAIGIPQ